MNWETSFQIPKNPKTKYKMRTSVEPSRKTEIAKSATGATGPPSQKLFAQRMGNAAHRAENLGDLITVDDTVLGHWYAVVVHDLATR